MVFDIQTKRVLITRNICVHGGYFVPRGFALARPLPRDPRRLPLTIFLSNGTTLSRLIPPIRLFEVEYFWITRGAVGGLSTKDVSVLKIRLLTN